MKQKTLDETCGYVEPAHLLARIKDLEAQVTKLQNELNDTTENLAIAENLLCLFKDQINQLTKEES